MRKVLVFGNSGSGKSTLARELAKNEGLAHLDLDTLAWLPVMPPQRRPLHESRQGIERFVDANTAWVIEGCYSDLLEMLNDRASEIIFLNLDVEQCIENARNRPWEPHKYPSKQAQDQNLSMLIGWIREYKNRKDEFSFQSHMRFYSQFEGEKTMYIDNVRPPVAPH